jgi:AraC-like DNA-binding protein
MPHSLKPYQKGEPGSNGTIIHSLLTGHSYKQQQIEHGLSLKFASLPAVATTAAFHELLQTETGTYNFVYCSNRHTAHLLSDNYTHSGEHVDSTRFLYHPVCNEEDSQHQVLIFVIDKNWINFNYHASASFFHGFAEKLPYVFSIADISILMQIDTLRYLSKIISLLQCDTGNAMNLRVSVLALIEHFFSQAKQATEKKKVDLYLKEMLDLAERINSFLRSSLPDLAVFAKEYNMSLSSLKRHFKQVHGKPIYEFYLDQKLSLARNILEQERKSIRQVASEMGYEDVTGFIKAFKKLYGIAPGRVKSL